MATMDYSIMCEEQISGDFPIFVNLFSRRIGAKFSNTGHAIVQISLDNEYVIFSENHENDQSVAIQDLFAYIGEIQESHFDNIIPIHAISTKPMKILEKLLQGSTGKYIADLNILFEGKISEQTLIRLMEIPIIDIIIEGIIQAIELGNSQKLLRCSITNHGILAISHDVDHNKLPKKKMLSRYLYLRRKKTRVPVSYLIKSILNLLPFINYTDNYHDFLNLESRYKITSTYFFLPQTYHEMSPELLLNLEQHEHEIAVHGNFGTAESSDVLSAQIISMNDHYRPQTDYSGIRQHYLEYSFPETWKIHAESNLKYDGTLGFSDMMGFRAGTAQPYQTGLGIVEIPLTIMDTYLRKFDHPDLHSYWQSKIRRIIPWIKYTKGILSINWHQAYLNMPFGYLLEFCIKECLKLNFEFLSHREINHRVEIQNTLLAATENQVTILEDGTLTYSEEFNLAFHPKNR